jgi:large subunit ribosomal protein L24
VGAASAAKVATRKHNDMNKIKKGDEIVVITGKDKGRRGTVLQVYDDQRVLVEGVNVAKKHQKPNPNMGSKKGERVGIRVNDDGSKDRIFRGTGETVDI